jgi:hypothetical protein
MSSLNQKSTSKEADSTEINVPEIDLKDINVPEIPLKPSELSREPREPREPRESKKSHELKEVKIVEKKKKKKDSIFLELGQFIEIEAVGNDDLNNKIFYIEYLDKNIISLINDIDKTTRNILLNNGKLSDESITAINIVYFSEQKGFARQNGLIVDSWWTFEFGGEVPIIINGQITNLENDMIELSLYPSREKIYIDFEYKGLPKNLNIIEIRPFSEPKVKISLDDIEEEGEESKVELSDAMKRLKKSQSEQLSIEIEIDEDDFDDIPLNFEEEENKEELQKILIDANSIILLEDEELQKVVNVFEVESEKRKYPIDFQINDMLDALLSEYPTSERNYKILENIHIIIDRFKDLRFEYSDFSNDGMIHSFKKNKNIKPLVQNLKRFDTELSWLIPIIKNKKKLYDLNIIDDKIEDDILLDETKNFINNYNRVLEYYKTNAVPDNSQKYSYIQQQINNIQLLSHGPNDRTNIINKVKINNNIHTIIDNLDEYNSSVSQSIDEDTNVVSQKKYAIQKYIKGENMLYKDPLIKRKIYQKIPIIQNESIYLKGFIMMPKYFTELSKLSLHKTSMYKKVLVHSNLKFNNTLENNELIKYNIDEDFEELSYRTNFLKFPSEISFVERLKYSDRHNDNIYEKFLDKMIPTTEKIIQNFSGYLKTETNSYKFLNELEPFLIYYKNLNKPQYTLINNLINENITKYKKTLSGRISGFQQNQEMEKAIPNMLDKLFSANDSLGDEGDEVPAKEVEEVPAKEGDVTAERKDPITVKINNLQQFIKKVYNLEERDLNSADIIREINNLDGGNLMYTIIGLLQIDLRESLNLQSKLEKEIKYADEQLESKEPLPENPCKNFVLTKTYTDIEVLQGDNNAEFVFYDKKYDNTPYDILNEFLKERRDMPDEIFKAFLKEHLINFVGVKPKIADKDAESMVIGQKRVIEGEYAILDMGDYEYRYYERINNQWRLKDELNDKMPDDSIFCNIKDKCLKINTNCAEENQNQIKIHNQLINDIIDNFSKELEKSYSQLKQELKTKRKKQLIRLEEKLLFLQKDFLKKNNLMLKISHNIEQDELKISPYSKVLNIILSQRDIVKKHNDIILFYNKYCRPYEITNAKENIYWAYCLDTNFPLMPTFLYELAQSYKSNNYQETINYIAKERGVLSNDGDKLVDKYSGYIIKYIEFDTEEGYNAEGYKDKSRDLLKEDDGDLIIETLKIREYSHKTKLAKVIYGILETIDKNIGFDMSTSYDFIVENISKILKNVISENTYKRKKAIANQKGKNLKSYNTIVDEKIINSIMALYIISVQSAIPPVQTSKTFPGCKRNFSGFPLDNTYSDNRFIEYILCIFLKIKNDSRPWTGLPRIRRKKDKSMQEKLDKIIIKFKKFMVDEILSIYEIDQKLKLKREWLSFNLDQVMISDEFNIKKWSDFLPPLNTFKIDKVKMFGQSIKSKLLATITKNKNEQFIIINKIIGKTKLFSLYIINKINSIIKRKDKLFVTNSGIPYIENACCNEKRINTYNYFIEEDPTIERDVNFVKSLSTLLNKIYFLNNTPYIFSDKDTKTPNGIVSTNFSEETIYKAFIKYCNYNTGLSIPPELDSLCIKNESVFQNLDTIEEKIAIIKRENGDIYNQKSLELLMKYMNRKNSVEIKFDKTYKINKIVFEELLKYIQTKDNIKICNKEIIPKILNLIQKYSVRYTPQDNDERDNLLLFLNEEITLQSNKINKFLKKNLNKHYNRISKFLQTFTKYDLKGNENYMSKEDETSFFTGSQINKMIIDSCLLYPNIILEKVSFDMYIPEHWNLSQIHENDIKKIINNEHILLNEFYNNKSLIKLLLLVKEKTVDLIEIVKNIPFYSKIIGNNKDIIINNEIFVKIHQYFFFCALILHIDLFEEMRIKSSLEEIGEEKTMKTKSVEATIMGGFQDNLEKTIANLLKNYILIFIKRKKIMNLTNDKIETNILKAKEQEKDNIRHNLKNLTVESRQIENIMKNHKLGRWSFGQSKAVFEYDADQYDKERNEIENRYLIEKKAGIITDTTKANMELFQMGQDEMDYLEKEDINIRINNEVHYINLREDGEADEEDRW